jgi:DnaK suppressor protein
VDPQVARQRLEEMLADLDEAQQTLTAEADDSSMHIARLSQHPADYGTDLSDQEREEAMRRAAETERHEVVTALGRIGEGSYGKCVVCGATIPDERLEARPEAIRCLEHQREYETNRD